MSTQMRIVRTNPEVLAIDRVRFEESHADDLDRSFRNTQEAGTERFGMRFVAAQEAAIAAGFGGVMPQKAAGDGGLSRSQRAQVSAICLAVLNRVAPPVPPLDGVKVKLKPAAVTAEKPAGKVKAKKAPKKIPKKVPAARTKRPARGHA